MIVLMMVFTIVQIEAAVTVIIVPNTTGTGVEREDDDFDNTPQPNKRTDFVKSWFVFFCNQNNLV